MGRRHIVNGLGHGCLQKQSGRKQLVGAWKGLRILGETSRQPVHAVRKMAHSLTLALDEQSW